MTQTAQTTETGLETAARLIRVWVEKQETRTDYDEGKHDAWTAALHLVQFFADKEAGHV